MMAGGTFTEQSCCRVVVTVGLQPVERQTLGVRARIPWHAVDALEHVRVDEVVHCPDDHVVHVVGEHLAIVHSYEPRCCRSCSVSPFDLDAEYLRGYRARPGRYDIVEVVPNATVHGAPGDR